MASDYNLVKNSGMFDEPWYVAQYPDVGMLSMDALEHYLFVGAKLGRNPSPYFDTKSYLRDNPDVAAAGVNPLVHYVRYGRREGRPTLSSRTTEDNSWVKSTQSHQQSAAEQTRVDRDRQLVFISGEPTDRPGYIYRIARYAEAFEKCGFKSTRLFFRDIDLHIADIENASMIFIWRAAFEPTIERVIAIAKKRNIPTVFDVDDLMVRPEFATPEYIDAIRYDKRDPKSVQQHFDRIRQTFFQCDMGSASTEELAWHMRFAARGKTAFVLPNGFGAETYTLSRVHARIKSIDNDGLVRIGYASGSRTHQKDFEVCAEGVAKALRENKNARLVLFKRNTLVTLDTAEFPCLAGLEDQIEWRPFVSHSDLPKEIARFDINLAPLDHGNPFVEAKSELKFFEAAIADVVTIASPTGPYKRAIVNGETGFLAETPQEWSSLIGILVKNPDVRQTIAREAHRQCLWQFGPTRRVDLAQSVIDIMKGGRESARAFRIMASALPSKKVPLVAHEVVFEASKRKSSKVSVIIPLFNYESYIEDALDSVSEQTMQDIELIVVDDCSTDTSKEVVLSWMLRHQDRFNRIVLAQHFENSGLGASRNTAFDLADTLYVMALDADNKLRPGCCEKLLRTIESEGAAFAYPVIQHFGDSTKTIGVRPFNPGHFVAGNQVDAMAMISKEAWSLVGGYATHRHGWQDFDLWCRFLDRGLHGVHVPEILAEYRVHDSSMLRTATDKSQNKERLLATMEREYPWLSLVGWRDGYRISINREAE